MRCPKCSQGFEYPVLRSGGKGTALKCPVCKKWFNNQGHLIEEPQEVEEDPVGDINWMYEGMH